MPTYVYERPDGSQFETQQRITDPPLTHDPESGQPVVRVLQPPVIRFRGSGFHNTDYGVKGGRARASKTD